MVEPVGLVGIVMALRSDVRGAGTEMLISTGEAVNAGAMDLVGVAVEEVSPVSLLFISVKLNSANSSIT